jgi:hypothetical protein
MDEDAVDMRIPRRHVATRHMAADDAVFFAPSAAIAFSRGEVEMSVLSPGTLQPSVSKAWPSIGLRAVDSDGEQPAAITSCQSCNFPEPSALPHRFDLRRIVKVY